REQERSDSGPGQKLYSSRKSAEVYERLADGAGHALAGGYTAIVDASFQRRRDRARFKTLAAKHGVELRVIHGRAPRPELEVRLKDRNRAGTDASEADLEVLAWQERHFEPLRESEGLATLDADTTLPGIADQVRHRLRLIEESPNP